MKKYIYVTKCTGACAWYSDKVGHTMKLDDKVRFDNCYTVRVSKKKSKANWGFVELFDAEEVSPSWFDRLLISMGITKLK